MPETPPGMYLHSGEFHHTAVDLTIRGRGIDFVWARKYRSRIGPNTAMGNGWDFTYNIRIEVAPGGIVLHDGNTRADLYQAQPDGTFTRREFFRSGAFNRDGTFTLIFPDTGSWNFHRLDGERTAGKIQSILDRNGNTITFDYDGQGRLVTIHDPLDTANHTRDITVAYNAEGLIASVTDFAGRQVVYEYYKDGDSGGSSGDLKSARSPVVVGTPTGNDFPEGKQTVYTYSKGFTDERLNHNLLTLTDPKGQTYLTNVYGTTPNPDDLEFDRLIRQVLGDPGDIIDIVYVSQVSGPAGSTARTIVNDRVGNVDEYFYDGLNRCVAHREHTGRWHPDQPTTEADLTGGPATPKLRASDPDFFETTWIWNVDSNPTGVRYPNGNVVTLTYELDLDPNAPWRSRGNLRERRRRPGSHTPPGDQAELVEMFEYETEFGGCCATNFVTCHVDARGNETLHTYDGTGNRIQTQHRIPHIIEDFFYNQFGQLTKHVLPFNGEHQTGTRREDIYEYYDATTGGHQAGYLKAQIIDQPNFALTTTYEYDIVGNMTRAIDPRLHDEQYIYNALDQLVRWRSRPVGFGSGVGTPPKFSVGRYEKDVYYDGNDNVVRVDTQNVDEDGFLRPNSHFTTIYEYDILNYLIRECSEVGEFLGTIPGSPNLPTCNGLPDDDFMRTEYAYDENRNRTLVRYGEAVENRQPANILRIRYDERDMMFLKTRAPGHPDQSSTRYDYDGNGNRVAVLEGIECAAMPFLCTDPATECPQSPSTCIPHVTRTVYDGFDRVVRETDPMGNVPEYNYDANGNMVRTVKMGELVDVAGGSNNLRLYEAFHTYDRLDRRKRTDTAFFDTETQSPIADGFASTAVTYTDDSRLNSITDDRGNQTKYAYDTANRLALVIDPRGNKLERTYDANSNVVSASRTEVSDFGNPDEVFTWSSEYDALDRRIMHSDPGGHTELYAYESRYNLVRSIDPRGNVTQHTYDGANRLIRTERELTDTGTGSGSTVGVIATTQVWDDTSRLIGQADDNRNFTSYEYDPLDRIVAVTYADGTMDGYVYDVHSNQIAMRDPNGSLVDCTYDLLDRIVAKSICPGPGVSSVTTCESFGYDGLSRIVTGQDDDSTILRSYNSLSLITRERFLIGAAGPRTVLREYDGVGNETRCVYPGGRDLRVTFDPLNREDIIAEVLGPGPSARTLADSGFEGCRFGGCSFGQEGIADGGSGPVVSYGYDGDRRVVETVHQAFGLDIDRRSYAWDEAHNKTQRMDMSASPLAGYTVDYAYDSVDRLIHSTTVDTWNTVTINRDYALDGVGNRLSVTGGDCAGQYFLDLADPPADSHMNQYTSTPYDARMYDSNGNLVQIDDGASQRVLIYDYKNQLVFCSDSASGLDVALAYDVFGRRIEKRLLDPPMIERTRFLYKDWQVIEEQSVSGTTLATYVYGPSYIDNVYIMNRDVDKDGTLEAYHYHWDDNFNVMVVSRDGIPVEYYEYRDFGRPLISDSNGSMRTESAIDNPYMFMGRRYDTETGYYFFRSRHLDPKAGRFISRDTVGSWGDVLAVGNGYTLVGNNPFSYLDPFGYGSSVECITCCNAAVFSFVRCDSEANRNYHNCVGDNQTPTVVVVGAIGFIGAGVGVLTAPVSIPTMIGIALIGGGFGAGGGYIQSEWQCHRTWDRQLEECRRDCVETRASCESQPVQEVNVTFGPGVCGEDEDGRFVFRLGSVVFDVTTRPCKCGNQKMCEPFGR